jgi:nicotinate-nucleotide adenylyltransferase
MAGPLGILGGTFDPIHHGHLRLALECREQLQLDEVRLVPVHTPPHREAPLATPEQRLRMAELAVRGAPGLAVDDLEIRRGGQSYTIDTLRALRASLGERPVCLLIGLDAFRALHRWQQWTALLDFAHLVVAQRPGAQPRIEDPELKPVIRRHGTDDMARLHATPGGAIIRIKSPLLDISSTRIRAAIAAGASVRYLLPVPVIDYIETQKIYAGKAKVQSEKLKGKSNSSKTAS